MVMPVKKLKEYLDNNNIKYIVIKHSPVYTAQEIAASAHIPGKELAGEKEFESRFPDCDIGAMPPFGNLYEMDVYVADNLSGDEEIAFNAGSHTELIKLAYKDFERLVQPEKARFSR
jgi:Ala-tRNA(Pro) deacylase